jgi:hypothetical protein
MDHSHPSADGVVRPKSRRGRRFAVALAAVAAVAAGGAHAALADGVQLTFSQNPVAPGANVTMTAAVSSAADEPDGNVTFVAVTGPVIGVLDDNPLGEPTTDINANNTTASFSTSSLAAGTYTIHAVYSPTGFPQLVTIGNLTSATETLVVDTGTPPPAKATTQVLLNAPSSVISTSAVTLTATVSRTSAPAGTPTGTVDFLDITGSSAPLGSATLVGGVATLNLANLAAGPHLIIALYEGDGSDSSSSSAVSSVQSTAPVQIVYQTTATVTTTPSTSAQGDLVTITATIVQTASGGQVPPPPGGVVTFTSDSACGQGALLGSAALGTGPAGVTVAANQAAIQTSTLQPCSYTITASYTGNSSEASGTASLSVAPRSGTNISYTGATSVEYGHPATLSANVTDRSGISLTGRTVTFALGTQQCSATVSPGGAASCPLTVTDDVPGGTLTVSVPQDVQTSGGSINLTFTVTPEATALTTGVQLGPTSTTLTGTLLTDTGAALGGQTVTLSLGSENCAPTTTTSAGVATCTVSSIAGQQTATSSGSFAGTTDYQPATAPSTTVQLVYPTSLVYTGAPSAAYNAQAVLSATLSDGAGGPSIAGRRLNFTLGTQSCTGTTDANGNAFCTLIHVTQDSGPYTVAVSYAGDAVTLLASDTSAAFNVTLAPTATTLSTPTVTSSTTTLSATLTSSGTGVAKKPMALSLGSSACTARTGTNGVATCSVTTPSGSSATFTATFAGDLDYATSTNSITVALLTPTTLAYNGATGAEYDDPALLSATLLGPGNKPLVLRKVTFTMGTQSCVGITDLRGVAFCLVLVSQPAGTYTVSASFAGNSTYAASAATGTFTVQHEDSTVVVNTASTALVGSATTLSGVLLEDGIKPIAGRTLTLTLGAQTCTGVTNAYGVATCTVVASGTLGPISAKASFAGDGYYTPSTSSTSALLYAHAPGGGTFVVGDHDDSGSIMFWGAQWSNRNSMSGGGSSSFKGYANHGVASCGRSWSADPGSSSTPPAGALPTYMDVIVASSTSKSGSSISGNSVHIVIVKTDAGYAGNPGHDGTGTVVATIS